MSEGVLYDMQTKLRLVQHRGTLKVNLAFTLHRVSCIQGASLLGMSVKFTARVSPSTFAEDTWRSGESHA